MTTFLYTGRRFDYEKSGATDGNIHDHINIWGQKFYRGIPLKVTEANAVTRLTGHPYFSIVPDAVADKPSATEPDDRQNALMADAPRKAAAKKG